MLIYVPSTSRAGIAILVCLVACCNLNFFKPHKNKALFWLSQISFITTAAKYVVALLLSANNQDKSEQFTIGVLLIFLDIFFMSSSVLAIFAAIFILHSKLKEIKKAAAIVTETHDMTHVVPINGTGNELVEKVDDPEELNEAINQALYNDFTIRSSERQSNQSVTQIQPVTARRSSIERTRSERSQIVHNIHTEHRISQINLDASIQMKGRKQRRQTQLRVKARAKLKKQKVLTRIPAFATLTEPEIDAMLKCMTRKQHVKDEVLCKQGDVADTFYIVMSGECAAYGKRPGEAVKLLGSINQFQFFGEASLLSEVGVQDTRKATVKVASDVLTVMVLTKTNFYGLIDGDKLNRNVLDGVKKVDLERQEQNSAC